MQHAKTLTGARTRWPDPVRVVVERSKLCKWYESSRWEGIVVSQCSGAINEMLAECERLAPCVFVVSQQSLERVGADEIKVSVGVGGSVRVLVLGARKDPSLAEKALSMGCMGYLPQDAPSSVIRRAVRAIAAGEVWADRSTVAQVMKKMLLRQLLHGLTLRERDILRLIASGLSNRAIADRLCITYETVRWHIRGLYAKLGVQDRFSAIVHGKRILDSEDQAEPGEPPGIPKAHGLGIAPQPKSPWNNTPDKGRFTHDGSK